MVPQWSLASGSSSIACVTFRCNHAYCRYYTFYPNISGIFLNTATELCTDVPYYSSLIAYIRGLNPNAVVALNWGSGKAFDHHQML